MQSLSGGLSTEPLILTNSGRIAGGNFAFLDSAIAAKKDTITNTGTMVGQVFLGNGDDVYNGASGQQTGPVVGGNGNDVSKYPPAKPGALVCEPLKAAVGVADAAPVCMGHLKVAVQRHRFICSRRLSSSSWFLM